jgi:hypothetical protein
MPWENEQERLTQEVRLSVASPEEVLRELKRIAQKPRIELMGRNEAIEALLVERNDPLITLGLACYGTSEEVFTALYKHGLAKPADTADERYKLGLRIGCLSNRSVVAAHWVRDFPRRLIGPEEIHRVLAAGDDAEAEALICNPSVSDELLEELYKRTDAFATLDEERWRKLVYLSRKNERLVTKEDSDDMPDMGHYSIHHAIFRLLEIAPVHNSWLHVLYGLLDQLNFQQVAHPETIEAVLSRWAKLDDKMEGYFTSLSQPRHPRRKELQDGLACPAHRLASFLRHKRCGPGIGSECTPCHRLMSVTEVESGSRLKTNSGVSSQPYTAVLGRTASFPFRAVHPQRT